MNLPGERVFRVLHMASCSRSGETLMLRLLAAHPEVLVAFDLAKRNTTAERAMREFFKTFRGSEVREHQLPSDALVPDGVTTIIVKQSIWEHRHPFEGFVLVRNPASVVASILEFDYRKADGNAIRVFRFWRRWSPRTLSSNPAARHWERVLRWQQAIDEDLTPHLTSLDYLSALCVFYNRRMLPLAHSGLPVVHYERLVTNPEDTLRLLMECLSLAFNESMLESHREYAHGTIGHGKNDLTRPIDQRSLFRYKEVLSRREFSRVAALTLLTWKAFAYSLKYDNVSINLPEGRLMRASLATLT